MQLFDNIVYRISEYYRYIDRRINKILYDKFLPFCASTQIDLLGKVRIFIKIIAPLSILIFMVGLLLWRESVAQAGALLMGIAGSLKMFAVEEWDQVLGIYADDERFPYGPPSYITREIFKEEDPDQVENLEHKMARFYFDRRGFLMIMFSFIMQFICIFIL